MARFLCPCIAAWAFVNLLQVGAERPRLAKHHQTQNQKIVSRPHGHKVRPSMFEHTSPKQDSTEDDLENQIATPNEDKPLPEQGISEIEDDLDVEKTTNDVDACDNLLWKGHFLLNKLDLPIEDKRAWEVVTHTDKKYVLWRKDGQLRISRSKSELNTKVRDFDETQLVCVTDLYRKFRDCPAVSWQDGKNTFTFHRVEESTDGGGTWATSPESGEQLSLWFRLSAWYVSPTDHWDLYVSEFDDEEKLAKLTCSTSSLQESHSEVHTAQRHKFRKFAK